MFSNNNIFLLSMYIIYTLYKFLQLDKNFKKKKIAISTFCKKKINELSGNLVLIK